MLVMFNQALPCPVLLVTPFCFHVTLGVGGPTAVQITLKSLFSLIVYCMGGLLGKYFQSWWFCKTNQESQCIALRSQERSTFECLVSEINNKI